MKLKLLCTLAVLLAAGFIALGFMNPAVSQTPVEKNIPLADLLKTS